MTDPTPAPDVPVLRLRDWPGERQTVLRQGVQTRAGAEVGESIVVAFTDAYCLLGQAAPAVVISQSPELEGRQAPLVGAALSWLLRRRWGRPSVDAPVRVDNLEIDIEGTSVVASSTDWGNPRIGHLQFVWRGCRRIEIAAWDYPIRPDLIRSLKQLR